MAVMALFKMEIDVQRGEQLDEIVALAKKHKCAAIVVPPDMLTAAVITRSVKQAAFKIITTVDHPRGELYRNEKFRGLPTEAMNAEGFEILLTARQKPDEIVSEVKYLSEFCRSYFGIHTEIRFVLDVSQPGRNPEFVANVMRACLQIPLPTLIRTTHHLKTTPNQGSIESFNKQLATLKSHCVVPIKISGNIESFDILNNVNAERFGVSYQQALLVSKTAVLKPMSKKPIIVPTTPTTKLEV